MYKFSEQCIACSSKLFYEKDTCKLQLRQLALQSLSCVLAAFHFCLAKKAHASMVVLWVLKVLQRMHGKKVRTFLCVKSSNLQCPMMTSLRNSVDINSSLITSNIVLVFYKFCVTLFFSFTDFTSHLRGNKLLCQQATWLIGTRSSVSQHLNHVLLSSAFLTPKFSHLFCLVFLCRGPCTWYLEVLNAY